MKIAYILFNGITLLDFIGFYDPIKNIKTKGNLEDLEWDLCAMEKTIKDSFGLEIIVDKVQPDLSGYDMVFVPGGWGTRPLQTDENFLEWLRSAKDVTYLVSVCTGSLLLGAASFLRDKVATTNFKEYKTLEPYCARVAKARIVEDGRVITAGAVASSLDLGLYISEKLIGVEKTKEIQNGMDYHPQEFEVLVTTSNED